MLSDESSNLSPGSFNTAAAVINPMTSTTGKGYLAAKRMSLSMHAYPVAIGRPYGAWRCGTLPAQTN